MILPPHLPILTIEDSDIGAGWRRVAPGERVRWFYQALMLAPTPQWQLTHCTGTVVTGRTHYRKPASIGAWVTVIGQRLARKD